MITKIYWRDESIEASYKQWRSQYEGGCTFCAQASGNASDEDVVLEVHDAFMLTKNRFPYAHWDNLTIDEHLMLVPKRHLLSIADMTKDESAEFATLLGRFDAEGYSIYARSHDNSSRTVPHIHIHLFSGQPIQ